MCFYLARALVFHQCDESPGYGFSSHCEDVETKAHRGDPQIAPGPMPGTLAQQTLRQGSRVALLTSLQWGGQRYDGGEWDPASVGLSDSD